MSHDKHTFASIDDMFECSVFKHSLNLHEQAELA